MTKKRAGLIGGAIGVAAATAAVVVAVDRSASSRRTLGPDYDAKMFGALPADRSGVLVADDGVGLYYEELGPDEAPLTVVFVHGYTLEMGSYHFQRQALSEQFGDRVRMLFYDQRSHGRSDRSDPEHDTIDQLGRDLYSVLETVVPEGPVVLVGHSMGGMTVMALADGHPELFAAGSRVVAVALLSTSAGKMASVTLGLPALLAKLKGPLLPLLLRGARRQAGLVERGRALGTDLAWVITRRISFAADDIDPATVEYLTSMIASTRIDVVADFYPALMNHDKLAAIEVLGDVDVLIMCGEKDLLTPLEHSRAMAEALPKAELIVVPQGGHVALMEHPDVFNEALARLIGSALDAATPKRRWWRR